MTVSAICHMTKPSFDHLEWTWRFREFHLIQSPRPKVNITYQRLANRRASWEWILGKHNHTCYDVESEINFNNSRITLAIFTFT